VIAFVKDRKNILIILGVVLIAVGVISFSSLDVSSWFDNLSFSFGSSNDTDGGDDSGGIEYYCNWSWPQQIIDKNTSEVLWDCPSTNPYCKAGTTHCCNYDESTKTHYGCIDVKLSNVAVEDDDDSGSGGSGDDDGSGDDGGSNGDGTPDGDDTQEEECTNTCATDYNQKPYPDCDCFLPEVTGDDFDGDGIPDLTDTDDDNDGFTDDEETQQGTDPKDENDFPEGTSEDCNTFCVDSGYLNGYSTSGCMCDFANDEVCQNFGSLVCCCGRIEEGMMTESECMELYPDKEIVRPGRTSETACTDIIPGYCNPATHTADWIWDSDNFCCAFDCEPSIEDNGGWNSGDLIWEIGFTVDLNLGDSILKTVNLDHKDVEGESICIEVTRTMTFPLWEHLWGQSDLVYLYVDPSVGTSFTFADSAIITPSATTTIPFSGSYGYTNGVPFEFEFENNIDDTVHYDVNLVFKIC